jgi:Zn-dependent protease
MYFPKGSLDMGKPGKFSTTEVKDLLIAMGVLTLAFSFAFTQSSLLSGFRNIQELPFAIPVSFLGILTAFIVHEVSHKFMAQKYGLWAEFRKYDLGLLAALGIALLTGFVIAAPGAVMFRGQSRPFEMGRIAAAGPGANIITAAVTYPLSFLFFDTYLGGLNIGSLFIFISVINSLLATFNLLPFGPLDGTKVIRWNGIVWSLLFVCSLILLLLNMNRGITFPRIL